MAGEKLFLGGETARQIAAGFAALVIAALLCLPELLATIAQARIAHEAGEEWIGTFVTTSLVPFYLVFWAAFAAVYCFWTHVVYSALAPVRLREVAAAQQRERTRWWHSVLGISSAENLTISASVVSAALILVIAQTGQLRDSPSMVVLAFAAVAGSWALMAYSFALRYLRLQAAGHPMDFPIPGGRRFGDYLTQSVTISTLVGGYAVPRTRTVWTAVRSHSVLALAFNTVIMAMTVSLLVGGRAG